jgi:hypothetical protein
LRPADHARPRSHAARAVRASGCSTCEPATSEK